ncbi:MAG: hypothetical protein ACREA9_18115 [Pyrinomonadaceae bacterium]
MNASQCFRLTLAAGWMLIAHLAYAGGETTYSPRVYPAYELKPGACYVLLKPRWSRGVSSGDYPGCRAVLDNLNKFCDEPPHYDRRKVHPTTRNLREPKWERIDAESHSELLKQTFLAGVLPEYREGRWQHAEKRILSLAASGALHLSKAELGGDLRGALETVYMLENTAPSELPEYNQPRLMFSEQDQVTGSPLIRPSSYWGAEDLLRFGAHWYLTGFEPTERQFVVKELTRPQAGPDAPVSISPVCTIQHINDRQGSE